MDRRKSNLSQLSLWRGVKGWIFMVATILLWSFKAGLVIIGWELFKEFVREFKAEFFSKKGGETHG
jgi:hypothetical protein